MTCVLKLFQYAPSRPAQVPTAVWKKFTQQIIKTRDEYDCTFHDATIVETTRAHCWVRDSGTEIEFESEEYLTLFCLRWA